MSLQDHKLKNMSFAQTPTLPQTIPPHQLLKCNWTHVSHILRIECISVLMLCLKTFEPLSLSLSWPVDTPGSLTHAFRSPAYPWEPTAAQWQRNLWYVKELRLLQLVWYGTMSLIYNCIIKLVWTRIPFYAFGYLNNSSFLALSISVQIRPGCPQWMLASQTLSVPWQCHDCYTMWHPRSETLEMNALEVSHVTLTQPGQGGNIMRIPFVQGVPQWQQRYKLRAWWVQWFGTLFVPVWATVQESWGFVWT